MCYYVCFLIKTEIKSNNYSDVLIVNRLKAGSLDAKYDTEAHVHFQNYEHSTSPTPTNY